MKYKCDNLNALRSYAAILIILMHILVNASYQLGSNIIVNYIQGAGSFVQLFFIISGFSLCCGYYEKTKNKQLDLNRFYFTRYLRILPFFIVLILLDFLSSIIFTKGISKEYFIYVFSNITLFFGFFPKYSNEIVGVSWSLGPIFAFYCLFPFIVFLIWNKKRAWVSFLISLGIYYVNKYYLLSNDLEQLNSSSNISLSLCYFIFGGILYLHKEDLTKLLNKRSFIRWIILFFCIVTTIANIYIPNYIKNINILVFKNIIVFGLWMVYAISFKSKVLSSKPFSFLSSISFEIFLSHMFIFRVVEKLNLLHIFSNDLISYIFVSIIVILGTIAFSYTVKKVINSVIDKIEKRKIVVNNS